VLATVLASICCVSAFSAFETIHVHMYWDSLLTGYRPKSYATCFWVLKTWPSYYLSVAVIVHFLSAPPLPSNRQHKVGGFAGQKNIVENSKSGKALRWESVDLK